MNLEHEQTMSEEHWEEPIGAQIARSELRKIYAGEIEYRNSHDTLASKAYDISGNHTTERGATCDLGSMLRRAYNNGYIAGHNDTVEGVFVPLHHSEMDEANEDAVREIFSNQ